jgi:hypothetical protein
MAVTQTFLKKTKKRKWNILKSSIKECQDSKESVYHKCLEIDFENTKILKIVKNPDEAL